MSTANHGGKGSAPRPLSVDRQVFANNWDAIFKKKKTDPEGIENVPPSNESQSQEDIK